jgi:magnesium chelatase family protein
MDWILFLSLPYMKFFNIYLDRPSFLFFIEKPSDKEELLFEKDFNQIIGHSFAKRALEIAAARGHHVFMTDGALGCGKCMLSETFPSILPPLSNEAQLEKVCLYQLAGMNYETLHLVGMGSYVIM